MTISQFLLFLIIGTGLSIDSFAVSVSCGLVKKQIRFKEAVPIASSLAFFQAIFPLIGWYMGMKLHSFIGAFDHWVAFGLLSFLGIRMIMEGNQSSRQQNTFNSLNFRLILGLSVATSIDALVVGLSLGVLEKAILIPVFIIGMVTFLFSMLGIFCGKCIPAKHWRQSFIMGGIVLTVLGIKILVEHVWFL